MYPERDNIVFHEPLTLTIEDTYGKSIELSHAPTRGDVLRIQRERDESGNVKTMTFTGNFHDASRQNCINFLERLAGMKRISDQEHQELLLTCPHPQIAMRGYVRDLQDDWAGSPHPSFFNFSFSFVRSDRPWQPVSQDAPADLMRAEGKEYLTVFVTADTTHIRDFAKLYFGKNDNDGERIAEIIRLNGRTPSFYHSMPIGFELKVPF